MFNTIIITIGVIIVVSLLSWYLLRKKDNKAKDKENYIEMTNLKEGVNEGKKEEIIGKDKMRII